jgi:hypothetical protein
MRYIDLPVPHGFLIWRGKQTAIAMNEPIPTDKLLIVSNGEAYGEAELSQPIATSLTEFERRLEAHCVKSYERQLWWPDATAFFVHNIKEFKRFDEPVLFEDGEMVDYKPTKDEQAFIDQATELPKMLVIDDNAVVMSADGQHLISDKILDFGDIARILEAGVKTDGSDNVLPIYSLALVRNPRLVVKKKEAEDPTENSKQEIEEEPEEEVIMPWVIAEDGFGECEQIAVVKVDDEEVVGCHETMEEAEAQLAALNIAEEERREDDEEKDDFEERVLQAVSNRLNGKSEKAGRRLKAAMLKRLKEAMATIKDLLSWAEYSGEGKSFKGGIAIKEIDGEPWHFMWSTNAFRDREKEIFSTKALDQFANEVNHKEAKGFFNFWHIPGTDFAEKQFIETVGRFLVEAGPYLKDEKGRAALEFFKQYKDGHSEFAPEGWGGSPEFRFNLEDRDDGVYDWLWIDRTSTLPRAAAANVWTQAKQTEADMSTLEGQRKDAAIALFGQDFIDNLMKEGEKRTETLEEAGVAHKGKEPEGLEVAIEKVLAKKVEFDFTPIVEVMTQMGETMKGLSADVEELKKQADIQADTETPRFVLQMTKRASEAQETELADDDDLKGKKPAETPADKTMAGNYFGR